MIKLTVGLFFTSWLSESFSGHRNFLLSFTLMLIWAVIFSEATMWTFQLVRVYGEDVHCKSLWVPRRATAREVCHLLVQTAHCTDQENWALLEHHPTLALGKSECNRTRAETSRLVYYVLSSAERCLEDHEVVLDVQGTWSPKNNTRFVFCKNYAKYEFFRNPPVRRNRERWRFSSRWIVGRDEPRRARRFLKGV